METIKDNAQESADMQLNTAITTEQQPQLWTEVNYQPDNYNPFVKAPLFGRSTRFVLCHEDGTREEVRQSFVVFRQKGAEEWEDDAPLGRIEAMVLGDDDDEVKPVELINLGVDADDFLQMEQQQATATRFSIHWHLGEVSVEGARKVDDDDEYEVKKGDLGDGKQLRCTLTPNGGGQPFTLDLQLPFAGFNITHKDGSTVMGDLEISADELDNYSYSFLGNEEDDRFAVSMDDLAQAYQYIWYEDGTLSVRNLKKKMEKAGEEPAQGKLADLLKGSRNALVKHKDTRWRITITKAASTTEKIELDPRKLARMVFERFETTDNEEELVRSLIDMEEVQGFQWCWLKQDDWSYEHLADLLDLDGVEQDQQKMMEQALRYNRYDVFMQRLRRQSLATEGPVQADALQMRNNKRKIGRCLDRWRRHVSGEKLLWEENSDNRQENIYFFRTFHSAFAEMK